MKIKVSKGIELTDGVHEGVIKEYSERTEPYHYLDCHIETTDDKGKTVVLKDGFSASVSPKNALGNFLSNFGVDVAKEIEDKEELDIDDLLPKAGTKVRFQTITKKTDRGEFSTIVKGSIKPLE